MKLMPRFRSIHERDVPCPHAWAPCEGLALELALEGGTTLADSDLDTVSGTLDEQWALAVANLAETAAPAPEHVVVEGAVPFRLAHYHGDDFTASHAVRLRELTGELPRFGFLFMAPTPRDLFVAPIDDLAQSPITMLMLQRALPLHRDAPDGVSDAIYWSDGASIRSINRTASMSGAEITQAVSTFLQTLLAR